MVERRRRESLDPRAGRARSSAAQRFVAALALLIALSPACIGILLTADSAVPLLATPAFAAVSTGLPHFAASASHARKSKDVLRRRLWVPPSRGRAAHRAMLATRGSHSRVIAHRDPAAPLPASSPSAASPTAVPLPATPNPSSPLVATPWRLTADGTWQSTVSMPFPPGDDPSRTDAVFTSASADIVPLDAHAQLAPGAIVTVAAGGAPVTVAVSASSPIAVDASVDLPAPPDDPTSFAAAAEAVGPHLVDVGWTPLSDDAGIVEYKVFRRASDATQGALIASISPSGHSWHDASASPGASYHYSVVAVSSGGSIEASAPDVTTPGAMPQTSLRAISGKGMFLFFSPTVAEANGYAHYDPDAVIARARNAGITHIELRMARGTFREDAGSGARAWLDALLDRAAAAGISIVAWQVPRRATSDDVATAVSAASYVTAAGNGFSGVALDIEPGANYMGEGDIAKERMVDDIEMMRQAVGPDYLVVATVMSPKLTHWTNARYPYDRIAPYASVLQPMEYWHHFSSGSHHEYSQDEVTSACADSVSLTRDLAGRDVPVNVAGQSDDLGTTGPPSGDEINWCLTATRTAGAVGQTFFDWRGTDDEGWSAISAFAW